MVNINKQIYNEITALLSEKIKETNFFNGTIECNGEDFYSELICTLIICRGDRNDAVSVLPVWWEYHLYTCDGEQLTDFDWNELGAPLN